MTSATRSTAHRKVLVVAALASVAAWLAAWPWIGGRLPLHGYLPPAVNSLTSQEGTLLVVGALVQILLVAAVAPSIAARWMQAWDDTLRKHLARRDVLYAIIGFLAAELALALAFGALDFHPITEDEKTYLFQARLLVSGRLTIPEAPEHRSFLQPFLVSRDGVVSGQYFWAQPALMAIGETFRWPWLAVGLEIGVAVFFSGKLAADLTDDGRVGLVAAAIVASSPLVIETGATLHNANLAIACAASALWGLARLARASAQEKRFAPTLALGIATGVALNNRLLDHAALLVGATLVVVLRDRGRAVHVFRRIIPAIVVSLPFIVALALANKAVTGSPFVTGYDLFNEKNGWKTMGFGEGPFGIERDVASAAAHGFTVWGLLASFVSGSPFSLLVLLAPVLGGRSRRLRTIAAALLMCAVYTFAYFFYCGASLTQTGPVYFDALMPVIAGAIAVAAVDLHDAVAEAQPEWRRLVPSVLVAQTFAAVVVFWPSQIAELVRLRTSAASCEDLVASHGIKSALVFVRADRARPDSWVAHPPMARPQLDDDVLFVRQRPFRDDNERAAAAYARGRPIYLAACVHVSGAPALWQYDPATQQTKPIGE